MRTTMISNDVDEIKSNKLPVYAVDVESCDSTDESSLTDQPYSQEEIDGDVERTPMHYSAAAASTVSSPPWHAYVQLASAVLSLSAIGPFLNRQGDDVDGTLKIFWRSTASSIVLLPFVAHTIARDGLPWQMSKSAWLCLVLAAAHYAATCVFFEWALERTSVGNALIVSNSQSLLLLFGKWYTGTVPVRLWEGTGVVVAFIGAALCSTASASAASYPVTVIYDQNATFYININHNNSTMSGDEKDVDTAAIWITLMGDFYALLSALAGIGYMVLTRSVRPLMDLHLFMFCLMFFASIHILLFLQFFGGGPSLSGKDHDAMTFDMDPNRGTWGWLQLKADRLPLELIMVLVCNLLGGMGYVRAMHYFDNVVISVAALIEPLMAEFLNCALGVGALPSWMGWWGNLLVACGTFAVVYQPPTTNKDQ